MTYAEKIGLFGLGAGFVVGLLGGVGFYSLVLMTSDLLGTTRAGRIAGRIFWPCFVTLIALQAVVLLWRVYG